MQAQFKLPGKSSQLSEALSKDRINKNQKKQTKQKGTKKTGNGKLPGGSNQLKSGVHSVSGKLTFNLKLKSPGLKTSDSNPVLNSDHPTKFQARNSISKIQPMTKSPSINLGKKVQTTFMNDRSKILSSPIVDLVAQKIAQNTRMNSLRKEVYNNKMSTFNTQTSSQSMKVASEYYTSNRNLKS